ncbi:hypothetical protein WMY93_026479 [Mugilogobius chulae]|uniref:Uncharacterized protein n=1 Tax=Mugilogobius chulae TaxID=88201 RepID=A0AAW0N7M5_9GOBI
MGSHLIWLSLFLIIYYMDQVQGNHKTPETSLKPSKAESIMENPVKSDLSTTFHNGLCKCKGNGRWDEQKSCPCTKSARRKNKRAKLRKLCQGKMKKHLKKCHIFRQRKQHLIVPF